MIIKFKNFEGIRSEYPDMFAPEKEENLPQTVPGFEIGTIDPEDTEPWSDFDGNNYKAESEQYKDFLKITKERNFKENNKYIKINTLKLYHDFYMSIYNPEKHYIEFIKKELIGKYIVDSVKDFDGNIYNGIIEKIGFLFDDYSAFLEIEFKEKKLPELTDVDFIITIDKMRTKINNYNL